MIPIIKKLIFLDSRIFEPYLGLRTMTLHKVKTLTELTNLNLW